MLKIKTWKALTKKNPDKTLVVVAGPTAVGKTALSVVLAQKLHTEIVSADARQFYREMAIGTARPTPDELMRVKHHLIGHLSIFDHYNVSRFEQDALGVLGSLFKHHDFVVVTGGSGLYIDTLCHGIDEIPAVDTHIRMQVKRVYETGGLPSLRSWLKRVDPDYYTRVDLSNPLRMMRGLEVYLQTGRPLSAFQASTNQPRPFAVKRILLNRPRHELFERINDRVRQMVSDGLVEEALALFPHRHLNALNTVGYRELFAWMANSFSLHEAIGNIQTNTRRYAKRQLTWFRRYQDARWFDPSDMDKIMQFITL